jgi:phosphoribosylamine--glycine ligase
MDALFSTVQMPPGVPVATMSIGKPGAKNAGILAAQILAISDPDLEKNLEKFKKEIEAQVEQKSRKIQEF